MIVIFGIQTLRWRTWKKAAGDIVGIKIIVDQLVNQMHVTVLDDATIVVGVDHVMHVVIIVSLIVDVRYVLPVEAEAAEMLVTVFVILALACPDLNVDAGVVPSVVSPLIAVMVPTFVGLITDVSVVSLMP